MPSPFPGMDPYLEHPQVFPDLHDRLITHLSESLQAKLPAPYYAAIGRRVWVEVSERFIGPDVQVRAPRVHQPPELETAGVALAAPESRAVVVRVPHDEIREPFVEIYAGRGDTRRVVTTIEVLSLANKTQGEHGRELYLRKQRKLYFSKVHVVEIDLLRGGAHATMVPLRWAQKAVGAFEYHVCVHRYDQLEDFVVYPIALQDPLPPIAVPLLPGDADVVVDLQAILDECYDAGPYRMEIDYATDSPRPPLTEKQAEWARSVLAAHHIPGAAHHIPGAAR